MPVEGGKDNTPLKSGWNRSSLSSANASFDGGATGDTSILKSFLDEVDEKELRYMLSPDVSMHTYQETTDESESSGNASMLEKASRRSRDSGISSVGEELATAAIAGAADDVETDQPPKVSSVSFSSVNYKHKLSIYSKVSGCRMTNLTDYWIVKQIRVAILQHLTNGDPELALTYKFGYEKMANGGLQVVSDSEQLILMLGKLGYFAGIPCKMTFPDTPRVVGFIKNLPTDLEPADLKDEIRKSYPEVYSVRYVTEKSRGFAHGMQRPCAFISFNLRYLPKIVKIFHEVFELQVPNPMQCTRCCRYGHQGKQCRAQTRCSFCGGMHHRQVCMAKTPSCINCQGEHTATSHDCLIWQQGKHMNELRYRGGLTAEEAIGIASSGKVSQKKHSFTEADYFENQDNLFFGDESVEAGAGENEGETTGPKEASPKIQLGKIPPLHPRTCRVLPFLDLMTDLFLRVKNPNQNYTSADLMPGYDDLGFPIRKNKRESAVARHFKESVKAAAGKSPPRY